MSFTRRLWEYLLPITTTLFTYTSCDSINYCGGDQVEHDETDSVSTIASFYTPLPPPSLVPTQSIPLVNFPVYGESHRHNAESLQQSTRERLVPLSLFPPFYLVFNEDIMAIIFALMDLPTLARCSRICKFWYQLAVAELWRDALSTGMRPLLEFMDTYYLESCVDPTYKKRRVRLSSQPSSVCWSVFQTHVGSHIRSLTFNTSSLVASNHCLDLLNRSAPRIELPGLIELRVVVDQTTIELELATKFMQPSVKHLHLEVWEPLPDFHRAHYVMQREAELDIRMFKFDEATPAAHALATFFSDVARYMPGITNLSFNMRDFDEMRRAWPDFLHLYASLPQLKTLELPLRALTLAAVSSLTGHLTLQYLGARDFRGKRNISLSEPYEDLLVLEGNTITLQPNTSHEWRGLTITATPLDLYSCFSTTGQFNLTLLHVNFCATVTGFDGINALIAAISESCPALQDLKLYPVVSRDAHKLIRPNLQMLEPLRKLHDLASLEIAATGASQFTEHDFAHIVSSWPQLKRLVLDHPNITVSEPFENARLSIGAVFRTLKKHCPYLIYISLYVSAHVGSSLFTDHYSSCSRKAMLPSLQKLSLFIGYPLVASADQIATYLMQELPSTCEINLDAPIRTIHSVMDPPIVHDEWMIRRRELCGFVGSVYAIEASIRDYRKMRML